MSNCKKKKEKRKQTRVKHVTEATIVRSTGVKRRLANRRRDKVLFFLLEKKHRSIRKRSRKTGEGSEIRVCSVQFCPVGGTQLRRWWMPTLPSPHRSAQRKKLLFLGCSVIFTP